MNTKSFFGILAAAAALSGNVSAQMTSTIISKQSKGYFNLSYSIGAGKDIYTHGYTKTRTEGISYSLDASYTPEKNLGYFANYSSTDLSGEVNELSYPFRYRTNEPYNFNSLTFGPRLYSNDKLLFADAGFGYYKIAGKRTAGFNAGVGARIKFSDSYAIVLSGRLHDAIINKNSFIYYGIYAGLQLNNSAEANSASHKKSKVSVTALAGVYDNGITYPHSVAAVGAEISYEIKPAISILLDYMHSTLETNSYFPYNSTLISNSGNDFSGGVRFYVTGNNFRVFVENSANLFVVVNTLEYPSSSGFPTYRSTDNYFGLNFGFGADCRLSDNISGIFKANIGAFVSEGSYYTGLSGGLKYGF